MFKDSVLPAPGSPLVLAIMFEEASEVFENMFKASFPLTFIVLLPAVLFLVSPLPAEAAHEFTVYRMQQYDLQGQAYDSSLLQDNVAFVLCLDTLGSSDSLHLHVSKPPKEGSPQHTLLKELETVSSSQYPEVKFSMVHKKINLADDTLAWEHERFGIRRLPAFTLSHLESHRSAARSSIMDVRTQVDVQTLSRNTKIIAEALARVIYNLTGKGAPEDLQIFTEQMAVPSPVPRPPQQVQEEQLSSVLDWLTSQPRAAQLVDKESPVVGTLEYFLSRFLKDVKRHYVKADKRDPEFVFYDQLKQVMNAYRVKPAIFDLLLALGIAVYLGVMYLAIQNFGLLYSVVRKVTQPKAKQH
ncbi:UNVERIFIED_CONTAM: hypothetical protein FKN15_032298 [Acipenser sinensis]